MMGESEPCPNCSSTNHRRCCARCGETFNALRLAAGSDFCSVTCEEKQSCEDKSSASMEKEAVARKRKTQLVTSGQFREVVYIFDREGARGGSYWYLVLDCGHGVARSQPPIHCGNMLSLGLAARLAPQRVRCLWCETGSPSSDPWILIEALGGPTSLRE